jgi:hypothetical protein
MYHNYSSIPQYTPAIQLTPLDNATTGVRSIDLIGNFGELISATHAAMISGLVHQTNRRLSADLESKPICVQHLGDRSSLF